MGINAICHLPPAGRIFSWFYSCNSDFGWLSLPVHPSSLSHHTSQIFLQVYAVGGHTLFLFACLYVFFKPHSIIFRSPLLPVLTFGWRWRVTYRYSGEALYTANIGRAASYLYFLYNNKEINYYFLYAPRFLQNWYFMHVLSLKVV